jgi:hypothetical protein
MIYDLPTVIRVVTKVLSTGGLEPSVSQFDSGLLDKQKWGHMFQGWRETLAMFLGEFDFLCFH